MDKKKWVLLIKKQEASKLAQRFKDAEYAEVSYFINVELGHQVQFYKNSSERFYYDKDFTYYDDEKSDYAENYCYNFKNELYKNFSGLDRYNFFLLNLKLENNVSAGEDNYFYKNRYYYCGEDDTILMFEELARQKALFDLGFFRNAGFSWDSLFVSDVDFKDEDFDAEVDFAKKVLDKACEKDLYFLQKYDSFLEDCRDQAGWHLLKGDKDYV